ncbi:MAG: hypothetical protein QG604_942, partial [Candidatus Dependentiae bacterium]|nr:hypothetical protein [Candidatus Dependentiae bacterium]
PETRALLSPMQKRRLWRVGLSAFLTFGSVAAFAVAIASALDAPKAAEAA